MVNFAFYSTKLLCRLPAFTEETYRDHYPASWNLRHVHFLFDATLNTVDIGKFAHKIISVTFFSGTAGASFLTLSSEYQYNALYRVPQF